jgi:hypothetical protein
VVLESRREGQAIPFKAQEAREGRYAAPQMAAPGRQPEDRRVRSGYWWIALSNTTLGTLMTTINGSIILIAHSPAS